MSPLRFGYGTNGLADHRLGDALTLLAEAGYDDVALTLDVRHLDPYSATLSADVAQVRRALASHGLGVTIETGARYLLDPRRKHQPTLVSEDPTARLDLLRRAIDIASDLGAEVVSFWSGAPDRSTGVDDAWDRLIRGCATVLAYAAPRGVTLAFEPEPGMLVADLDGYARLVGALDADPTLALTMDIGHVFAFESDDVGACIRRWAPQLRNVQIEDHRRGVHEHLPFGEGDLPLTSALAALAEVGYRGTVGVELPRHGHAAALLVPASIEALRAAAPPVHP